MTRLVQLKRGRVRGGWRWSKSRICAARRLQLDLRTGQLPPSATGVKLSDLARQRATRERLDYDADLSAGNRSGSILPAIDHPEEPARCMVSGTGLTHLGSARNRQIDARGSSPKRI